MSKIEWTERTWNPLVGCSKISAGCENCYALRMAWRLMHNPITKDRYEGVVKKTAGGKVNWTGTLRLRSPYDQDNGPLYVIKPTTWFVNSMSDLFHEHVSFKDIDSVYDVMDACRQHTFQLLTKRPQRMLEYYQWKAAGNGFKFDEWPLPNVWVGVSVENQPTSYGRIHRLLEVPAAVRFLSCEPLLGHLNLKRAVFMKPDCLLPEIQLKADLHWVIAGGESGPNARPMHPDWVSNLRDECVTIGIPFFFKQWGEWAPASFGNAQKVKAMDLNADGRAIHYPQSNNAVQSVQPSTTMYKVGKKLAGRALDGREWNEMPVGWERSQINQ